jgi:hypothetical protein
MGVAPLFSDPLAIPSEAQILIFYTSVALDSADVKKIAVIVF